MSTAELFNFLLEESLMRLTHYPGFEIHKQQHDQGRIRPVRQLERRGADHHEKEEVVVEVLVNGRSGSVMYAWARLACRIFAR